LNNLNLSQRQQHRSSNPELHRISNPNSGGQQGLYNSINFNDDDMGPMADQFGGGIFDPSYNDLSRHGNQNQQQPSSPDRGGYNNQRRTTSASMPVNNQPTRRMTNAGETRGYGRSQMGMPQQSTRSLPVGGGRQQRRSSSMGMGGSAAQQQSQQYASFTAGGGGGGVDVTKQRIADKRRQSVASSYTMNSQSIQHSNSTSSKSTRGFNNSRQGSDFNVSEPGYMNYEPISSSKRSSATTKKPNRRTTTTTANMTGLRSSTGSNESTSNNSVNSAPNVNNNEYHHQQHHQGSSFMRRETSDSNGQSGGVDASNRTGVTQVRRGGGEGGGSIDISNRSGTASAAAVRQQMDSSNRSGVAPPQTRNHIVNNNGRGGVGLDSSNTSRSAHASSTSSSMYNPSGSTMASGSGAGSGGPPSSMRLSSSAKENPSWFNTTNEESVHSNSYNNQGYDDDSGDDDTMVTMATKAQALNPKAMAKAKHMTYPQGEVTIIYTDVQGSTSFWETCPSDMKTATDIHDKIMRQCYTDHQGYEITTEGDAFNLAFQHPADALAFALQAQLKLYKADWPMGILNHPDGKDEPALKYRGFRVRFGIHHGHTTSRVHENTGRTIYAGDGVKIAKSIEGMCHGGQILTSMETWKAVSGMAERYLGRPQVLDCGEHLLFETKNQTSGSSGVTTTRYTRRIMQLVPSDLAFDFFEARGRRDVPSEDGTMGYEIKDAKNVSGRLFPPLISKRQLTTCFLNAPYANGKVTICFVYTVGLGDSAADNKARNLGVLAKCVRKQLLALSPPGYECQEDDGCWMLAFDRMAHAVTFGLNLKAAVMQGSANDLVGSVDRENMFKVGVLSGPFTSMGPHKTTGMADYFGPIVNRAARVASNCDPGQICVGIPLSNGVSADPPDFGPSINVRLQGIKKLKGITIDVAIFSCNKKRIETPYK